MVKKFAAHKKIAPNFDSSQKIIPNKKGVEGSTIPACMPKMLKVQHFGAWACPPTLGIIQQNKEKRKYQEKMFGFGSRDNFLSN